jgi:hypothetical protein
MGPVTLVTVDGRFAKIPDNELAGTFRQERGTQPRVPVPHKTRTPAGRRRHEEQAQLSNGGAQQAVLYDEQWATQEQEAHSGVVGGSETRPYADSDGDYWSACSPRAVFVWCFGKWARTPAVNEASLAPDGA